MSRLMISVSGIRGIVGETLTPDVIVNFAEAYGTFCGPGKIVVGSDTRITGHVVKHALLAGLYSVGCDVIDVGICPTPTVQMATEKLKANGGIIITASHNPIQWNALKLLAADGLFLDAEQGQKVIELAETKNFRLAAYDAVGHASTYADAIFDHEQAVLDLPYINIEKIQAKKYKVVVDCVNGAGSVMLPAYLEKFGCEVIPINCTPDGRFPHIPEPVPENLTQLSDKVRETAADIGFAVDPDSDRLALISNEGIPLGEEYTLALAIQFMLSRKKGKVVINASTSLASEDVAKQMGAEVIRTKVGEIHVAKKMREVHAVVGGEGNGGVILPDVHLGRDAIVGIALILQHLADLDLPISEICRRLPQYVITKKKIELTSADTTSILNKLVENHRNEMIDRIDGVKFLRPGAWVQVRASNTEPILRIMSEAPSAAESVALCDQFINEIKRLL
ncbi:phosphoglucosamine mutase [candidate division KSB1 bacterium]|nr:phosphoglucosamine mutase [candidate division KSB1 bacterium]